MPDDPVGRRLHDPDAPVGLLARWPGSGYAAGSSAPPRSACRAPRPSVSIITPARRAARDVGQRPVRAPLNRRVPSRPPSGTVTVRKSMPRQLRRPPPVSLAAAASTQRRAVAHIHRRRCLSTTRTAMSGQRLPRFPHQARTRRAIAAPPRSTAAEATTRRAPRRHTAGRSSASTHSAASPASKCHRDGGTVEARSRSESLFQPASLLPQPFEDMRHVHLVAFVIARQRVDHQVHAEPERQRALPRAAGKPRSVF